MISNPDNEQDQAQTREAFIARLESRLEQAQADRQSPEEIQSIVTALGREELQRQLPQLVVQARSWWTGFRRFLIVGTLALGFAIGLALYVEHHHAAPLCERYAAQHGLTYKGLTYPIIGTSSGATSSSGSCIFINTAGHENRISLATLAPNAAIVLLFSSALQLSFTTPVAFILISLIAVSLFKFK